MLPYGYDPNAVEEEGGAVAETGVPTNWPCARCPS